ncbi:MAG: DUF1697 domain-containing protein [Candidatus Margulisiibacteriota bacterium]
MKTYIAFLRGINVGGNNLLPMSRLKLICNGIGLLNVRTYIQSGNVIFESPLSAATLLKKLEQALALNVKKEIAVVIRTEKELKSIIACNPFPAANPAQVGVMFLAKPVPADFMSGVSTPGREIVKTAGREVYIHYPDGMGRSRLKLPKAAATGTVRNLNTIAKLVELSRKY